jgi:hypothetical protein
MGREPQHRYPRVIVYTVLLWFRVMVMLRFLSRTAVFLAFPPLLLFALNQPCRLAAAADALWGMVSSDLLLLCYGQEATWWTGKCKRAIGTFPPT